MSGEKKRVSDEIVNVIDMRAQKAIELLDHGQSEQVDSLLSNYRTSVENQYEEKLKRLKEKQAHLEHRETSALEFGTISELKRYRNELLNEFKVSLEKEVIEFTQDETKYKEYITSILSKVESGGVVSISSRDLALVEGFETEVKELRLGGLMYTLDNRLYDFSLETRFNNAMKKFVETSQLWIRSDEN